MVYIQVYFWSDVLRYLAVEDDAALASNVCSYKQIYLLYLAGNLSQGETVSLCIEKYLRNILSTDKFNFYCEIPFSNRGHNDNNSSPSIEHI